MLRRLSLQVGPSNSGSFSRKRSNTPPVNLTSLSSGSSPKRLPVGRNSSIPSRNELSESPSKTSTGKQSNVRHFSGSAVPTSRSVAASTAATAATAAMTNGHNQFSSLSASELQPSGSFEHLEDDHSRSHSYESADGEVLVLGRVGGAAQLDAEKLREKMEELSSKIAETKEQIKAEQICSDENVDQYLKMSATFTNATAENNPQFMRLRQIFEKKNNKTAQNIQHLKKKLETYIRRLQELEDSGSGGSAASTSTAIHQGRKGKDVLKDVGQNLKDLGTNVKESISGYTGGIVGNLKGGLSGIGSASQTAAGTVMSVPKELAQRLLKVKSGSADDIHQTAVKPENILTVATTSDGPRSVQGGSVFYTDLPSTRARVRNLSDDLSVVSADGSPQLGGSDSGLRYRPAVGSQQPQPLQPQQHLVDTNHQSVATAESEVNLQPLLEEVRQLREGQGKLHESLDALRSQMTEEYKYLTQVVRELHLRQQRHEEQMNDTTELHQAEVSNLKQDLASMEEKIEYREEERLRELQDALENAQTRISKFEHSLLGQTAGLSEKTMRERLAVLTLAWLTWLVTTILTVLGFCSQEFGSLTAQQKRGLLLVFLILFISWGLRSSGILSDGFLSALVRRKSS